MIWGSLRKNQVSPPCTVAAMGNARSPQGMPMAMAKRAVMDQIMVAVFAPTPAVIRGRRRAG